MMRRFKQCALAIAALGLLAGLAATMTACNTVEGLGEDTAAAGNAVAETSRDVRD